MMVTEEPYTPLDRRWREHKDALRRPIDTS
jgi:hypothetical protein